MGFFDKIKQSLTRTTQQFLDRFDEVVRAPTRRRGAAGRWTSRPSRRSRRSLISADVGVAATERIVEAVQAQRGAARRCATWSSARS